MKNYLLILSALLFSFGAYAQPSSDWPAQETTGSTQDFNIAAINLNTTINGGDEIAIFARVGGVTYNLGERTITQLTPTFGVANFSGATTLHLGTGGVTGADLVFLIQIYDTDNSGGGATPNDRYYQMALSPAPTIASGNYNANGKAITVSSPSALPVELTSFTGNYKNNTVALNWATASEEDNEFFTVERSTNGSSDFKELENIAGAGTTIEAQEYTYTDEQPENGVNYYRLKQTDFDGNFTYSEVIAVKTDKTPLTVNIFPNPVVSTANITLPVVEGEVTIKVMDLSGREVLSQTVSNTDGQNVQLDMNELQAGMYMIVITNGEQVVTKQIQLTK